tara:strand:- start:842 stop:1450 length:609 start_codon:yes stop_codon:yes gene_type:complete
MAWYQRWTRPTSEKQQSFNDIWVTKEELLDRPRGNYAIDNVQRSINVIETKLYTFHEDYVGVGNENLIDGVTETIEEDGRNYQVVDTKGKFYLYDNLRDRDKRMLDRMAKNTWDGVVSRLKRSNYGFSMQTPATKRRELKRIIPDELLREFSEEEKEGLEKLVASNYKRSLKYIIEDFNEEMFDAKRAAIQIREILNLFRMR